MPDLWHSGKKNNGSISIFGDTCVSWCHRNAYPHWYSESFRISGVRKSVCSSVILEPSLEVRMLCEVFAANEKLEQNASQSKGLLSVSETRLSAMMQFPFTAVPCRVLLCSSTYFGGNNIWEENSTQHNTIYIAQCCSWYCGMYSVNRGTIIVENKVCGVMPVHEIVWVGHQEAAVL